MGMYNKYTVAKSNGETDPNADYFVLRIDKDPIAQLAALRYAALVEEDNPTLASDLRDAILEHCYTLCRQNNHISEFQLGILLEALTIAYTDIFKANATTFFVTVNAYLSDMQRTWLSSRIDMSHGIASGPGKYRYRLTWDAPGAGREG
jgi:hypothetical protein